MKKFLAIFLALMMVCTVLLVSCNKKDDTPVDNDDWDNEEPDNGTDDGTDSGTDSGTDKGTDSGTSGGNTQGTSTNSWIEKNDKVYVGMNSTNLREGPGTGYKKALQVNSGTELARISTNGVWDKVKYQDVEYYVDSYLVTTNGGDFKFGADLETPVSLTINGDNQINLRSTPFVSDSGDYSWENVAKDGLSAADVTAEKPLMKIGVSENGAWYKVTYDGKTYYIKASLAKNNTISDPTVTPDSGSGSVGGIG